jgi:hypothetical protein
MLTSLRVVMLLVNNVMSFAGSAKLYGRKTLFSETAALL